MTGWKILSPKFLRTFGVLFRLVANTMGTSLKLAYQINSSPLVAVLAVTKFNFCCIALTCQTYFLRFLDFMSGGALVSQHGAWAPSGMMSVPASECGCRRPNVAYFRANCIVLAPSPPGTVPNFAAI